MAPREKIPRSFRCEWCSEDVTELRGPGPLPRYCIGCKADAQRALTAGRVRRYRERQPGAPLVPRPRGRPKGS
jgi:hypothetical protein